MVLIKKIEGFTIIETLIALLVIMLCFSIGGLIITNVLRSDDYARRTQALLLIKEMRMNSKMAPIQVDEVLNKENIKIKKTVNRFGNFPELIQVVYTAYDSDGKKLLAITEIETIP